MRWKWLLVSLCTVVSLAYACVIFDNWGAGTKPWFGFWDAVISPSARPFAVSIHNITPRGAADRAGLHNGDTVDLRSVGPYDRVALLYQPNTRKAVKLPVMRAGRIVPVTFYGSTQYDGDNAPIKTGNAALWNFANLWVLCCSWVIALRASSTREARLLCLALLGIVGSTLTPTGFMVPDGVAAWMLYALGEFSIAATMAFALALAMTFGKRSGARRLLQFLAAGAIIAEIVAAIIVTFGGLTARVDPIPFVFGELWQYGSLAAPLFVSIAAAFAIASSQRFDRARAAWLLLPLPLAILLASFFGQFTEFAGSWAAYMAAIALANAMYLFGAMAVTYALMRRRVFDFSFVVSRTLVVGGVSAVVVVSFVLLEWLLGGVVTNASHATGLAANAVLALTLGVSMRFIHRRVDGFVDFAFFHRRHEDERALREFAKSAAFVTSRDALLDRTIEIVKRHTDALSAAILLDDSDGTFVALRSFGDAGGAVDENDAAVLALKTRRAPVDPHGYGGAMVGDIAIPMLSHGQTIGILLCGARASGEAYAPDEAAALEEVAHGVADALQSIDWARPAQSRDDELLRELRALRAAVERGFSPTT